MYNAIYFDIVDAENIVCGAKLYRNYGWNNNTAISVIIPVCHKIVWELLPQYFLCALILQVWQNLQS